MSKARGLRTGFITAATAVLAMSACSSSTAVPLAAVTDLQTARTLWAAGEPAGYEITLELQCFCGLEVRRPVMVTVRGGQIEERRYALGGAQVDTPWTAMFTTVDGLFDIIQDAMLQNEAHLEATYDPKLGYPVRIDIDFKAGIADDEITYFVRNFRTL